MSITLRQLVDDLAGLHLPRLAGSRRPVKGAEHRGATHHESGLSRVFRGKFVDFLKRAFRKGQLRFHGKLECYVEPRQFEHMLDVAVRHEWVVYAKRPFGGPEQVLKYLARYTHRVAISNSRLTAMETGKVSFRWKDYADGNREKIMTLDACEFIRRFLMHVVPSGFMRIRHYGFLGNRYRQVKLALCRRLLGIASERGMAKSCDPCESDGSASESDAHAVCPACGNGRMWIIETFRPDKATVVRRPFWRQRPMLRANLDTS